MGKFLWWRWKNKWILYELFIEDEETGKYERFEECHYEKAYSIETIKNLIEKSGMKFIAVYDAYTFEPAKEDSERIFFIAKEVIKKEN